MWLLVGLSSSPTVPHWAGGQFFIKCATDTSPLGGPVVVYVTHFLLFFFFLFFLAYFLGRLTRDMTTGERERERERELCNSNISYMTGPRQSFLPFPSPVVYAFPLAAGGGGGGYIDY